MNVKALEILKSDCHKAEGQEYVIPFELDLYNIHLNLCAVCSDKTLSLKDLVYPSHQLCDMVVQSAIQHQLLYGEPVKCSPGCMTCCKYTVNVSVAEAFAIKDIIDNLPRQSRLALLRDMTIAGRKILNSYPATFQANNSGAVNGSNQLKALSRWYSAMNMACPWLKQKRCSYYENRPLVCKEFLVTSSPMCCSPPLIKKRIDVDLPVRMSEVLMDVCTRLIGTKLQAMFLPLIPAWCEDLSALENRRFDVRQTAELLIEVILEHQRNKKINADACCQSGVSD